MRVSEFGGILEVFCEEKRKKNKLKVVTMGPPETGSNPKS